VCRRGEGEGGPRGGRENNESRERPGEVSAARRSGIVVNFFQASDSLTGRRPSGSTRRALDALVVVPVRRLLRALARLAAALVRPAAAPPRARVSPRRVVATPARPRDILHEPVVPVPPRGVRDASRVEDVRGNEALLDVPVVVLVPALVPREHLAVRRRVPSVLRRFGAKGGEASSDGRRTKGKKMWRQARPRRARDDRYPRPRARTLSTATPTPTSTKSASRDRFSVARLDRLSEPRNAIARAPGGRAAAQCARRANDRRKTPTGRRSPGGSSWKNDR